MLRAKIALPLVAIFALLALRGHSNPIFGLLPSGKVTTVIGKDPSNTEQGIYSKDPNPPPQTGGSKPGGGATNGSSGSGDSAAAQGDALPLAGCNLTSVQQDRASATLVNVSCKTLTLYHALKYPEYNGAACDPPVPAFVYTKAPDSMNCSEVSQTDRVKNDCILFLPILALLSLSMPYSHMLQANSYILVCVTLLLRLCVL